MKTTKISIIVLSIFSSICSNIFAEDVILNIKATQGADSTSIDSIEVVNKSNESAVKVATKTPLWGVYQLNLSLGEAQLTTGIKDNLTFRDRYFVRKCNFGVEVVAKQGGINEASIAVYKTDGQLVFKSNQRVESGFTYPIPLSLSGIYFVSITDNLSTSAFKIFYNTSSKLGVAKNLQSAPSLRKSSTLFSYTEGDSIQIRVQKANLWSIYWHGRPLNNDTATLVIPTSNNRFSQQIITDQEITINPSSYAPLTARINLTTASPTRVVMKVFGKNGVASDVVKSYDTLSTTHSVDVLGLYANYANIVQLSLFDENGQSIGSSAISMQTIPLSVELGTVSINTSLPSKKPGMTLVSYRAYLYSFATKPFIFDEFGNIRWYLDYSTSSVLSQIMYDVGMERLRNGNLYFGDSNTNTIYEINMFGEILNSWPISGYDFHHQVLEKPNGNFIVNVDKRGLSTIEDFMIEIDRNTKQIINTWDLRQSLQYSRKTLAKSASDWIHTNAVEYDPSDSTIVVSGRTQGVVKLDANNHVKWLMAPHRDWGIAGNGVDLNTKLLQPLDANNQPITDTMVVKGYTNHPDFEWNWCQHAIKKQPNGHYTLFDNGDQRNFTTFGPYSRAVEYEIDETNMTIKQIWQYGKERGTETYSRIVSDVDFLNDVNHVIFSPGAISYGRYYAKAIEVDYNTKEVIFEATIYPPIGYNSILTLHRTERLNLYP